MHSSHLDDVLWAAGSLGQLFLFGVLLSRKIYRTFPIFCAWLAFIILSEPALYWILHHASPRTYYQVYFALNFPQYFLEACVLLEVAANVLQSVRKALPKGILYFVAMLMVAIGGVGLFISAHLNSSTLANPRAFMVVNMAMAILRLVSFIVIAGFSQVLGIGWKNHALQLVSGLAFYAAVTVIIEAGVSYFHGKPDFALHFYELERFRVVGYLCTLYYWCYSFVRKEAPRKEFNSKMSEVLLSIAGTAKRQQLIVASKQK